MLENRLLLAQTFTDDVTFVDGDVYWSVHIEQDAHAEILGGLFENRFQLYDNATAYVAGGEFRGSFAAEGSSRASIHPGTIIGNYINVLGSAELDIYGGRMPDVWLDATKWGGNPHVTFHGYDLTLDPDSGNYGDGLVTGVFADGSTFVVHLHGADTASRVSLNTLLVVDAGEDLALAEGQLLSLEPATFLDRAGHDTHTATIDWGDGTTDTGVVALDAGPVAPDPILTADVAVHSPGGQYATLEVGASRDTNWGRYHFHEVPSFADGQGFLFWQFERTGFPTILDGLCTFEVLSDGPVLLACRTPWGGGGNPSGGWLDELTTREEFEAQGWSEYATGLTTIQVGHSEPSSEHIVFRRDCVAGELFTYRTEKYQPPIVIRSETPPPTPSTRPKSGTVSGSHVYADDGVYTVTLTVDNGEGSATDIFEVTVGNAAPALVVSENRTVREGEAIDFDLAAFTDPGTLDSHTVTVDWGDGHVSRSDIVRFEFNPADFFDFRLHDEGPSTDGGMLRLHETGGFLGGPTYDSWAPDGWAALDLMRDSLDDAPEPEGIGYVQVYLLKTPDPSLPVSRWGQSLTAKADVAPEGVAPEGWEVLVATGSSEAFVLQWQAESPEYLVRPGEDSGPFELAFATNQAVLPGEDYTLWFGGDNYPDYIPGIDFGAFPGGFAADKPVDSVGTAYEATRSLTAIVDLTVVESPFGPPGSIEGMQGTASGSHVYADNGTYTVIVTITDDDGGSATDSFEVIVDSIVPVDGVLHIVGTSGDDSVTIAGQGNGRLRIDASFFSGVKWRTFDRDEVDLIQVALGAGDDRLTVAGNVDTQILADGGPGHDALLSGSAGNALLGGPGMDVLWGGAGRDLLIGGLGADLLWGRPGEDILVCGQTVYDSGPPDEEAMDVAGILAILDTWYSEADRTDRIETLSGDLDGEDVFDDGAVDRVFGATDDDWLIADPNDEIPPSGIRRPWALPSKPQASPSNPW